VPSSSSNSSNSNIITSNSSSRFVSAEKGPKTTQDLASIFRQRLEEQKKQQDTMRMRGPASTSTSQQGPKLQRNSNALHRKTNPQNQRSDNFRGSRNPAGHPNDPRNQRNDHGHGQQNNATNTIRNRLAQQLGNHRNDNRRNDNNPLSPRPPQTFGNHRNDNRRDDNNPLSPRLPQTFGNHRNDNRRNDNNPLSPRPPQTPSVASSIREMLARTSVAQQSRHPTLGERPRESHSSISNMLKDHPQRPVSSAKSIRDMLVATASASPVKKRDMTDVTNLREAFLKSIEIRKEKMQEERIHQNTVSQPAWRRDGARGFRKRLQEQQKVQAEKLEQQRRMRAALNKRPDAFLMTHEAYTADQQEQKRLVETKKPAKKNDTTVLLPPRSATITELSALFRVKIDKLMAMLRALGERPSDEHYKVDLDVMELVAMELGLEPVRSTRRRTNDHVNLLLQRRAGAEAVFENDEAIAQVEAYDSLPSRPPVVCIMGHVDHGKTTLMDALREKSRGESNKTRSKKGKKSSPKKAKTAQASFDDAVAGTEAGGITQVISAFQVPLENQDNAVTFLDTPGHAAFRAMRESGSNAADVIVLVVAADDGVSPQTIEIINFYKSIVKGAGGGGISMVVAMTKIDKHGIDITESRQRIENQLLEHGILSESFGSSSDSEYGPPVQVIPVSGLSGEGLDDLIEGLVLQSEVMDLRADEKAQAEGIVMDARMEKGVGVVADCIVRWGSLKCGNVIVSGVHSGKVKALKDSKYIPVHLLV
jgi:small GTP-binding protein